MIINKKFKKMKTDEGKHTEWLSVERTREISKNWLSDLNFIKDEQLFLEELITSHTQKILEEHSLIRTKMLPLLCKEPKEVVKINHSNCAT